MAVKSEVIKLDVGGSLYTTSRSTLTRYPDSMLGAMFSGHEIPVACDDHGRYVIDGDGSTFRYVLNFLRRSKLDLPEDFKEWDLLTTEADFYQVKELIVAVASLREDRKAETDCKIKRTEFIEIGIGNNNYYYYGLPETLKQIPLLFQLIQNSYTTRREIDPMAVQYFSRSLHLGKIELNRDEIMGLSNGLFEQSRLQIFHEIALLGFEFVNISCPWLFKRKL